MAICELEQAAKHDRGALIPADVIKTALIPEFLNIRADDQPWTEDEFFAELFGSSTWEGGSEVSNRCCTCKCDKCNPTVAEERKCDNCSGKLGDNINPRGSQYINSLDVRISGGFGQYIDGASDTLLCGSCAERLLGDWPCLIHEEQLRFGV